MAEVTVNHAQLLQAKVEENLGHIARGRGSANHYIMIFGHDDSGSLIFEDVKPQIYALLSEGIHHHYTLTYDDSNMKLLTCHLENEAGDLHTGTLPWKEQ